MFYPTDTQKRIAYRLVMADAPKLSTQDIADYLEIKPVTLRSWITRKYIKPIDVDLGSSGRGKSSFFSPLDVAQLMVCAKMTRLSIVPSFLTAEFTEDVTENVLGVLHSIAGTESWEQKLKDSTNKFFDKHIERFKKIGCSEEVLNSLEEERKKALLGYTLYQYYGICYSPLFKKFIGIPSERGSIFVGGTLYDPVMLVFDCLDVAKKLIALYNKHIMG